MQTHTTRHSRDGRSMGRRRPITSGSKNQKQYGRTASRSFQRGARRGSHRTTSRKLATFDPSQFINTNPTRSLSEVYEPTYAFATFGLSEKLVRGIAALGLEQPSPIQDQVIPHILEGKDIVGVAETGTGKTAAFLIPLIEKALQDHSEQTLILTPTRELAIQVQDELKKLSLSLRLYSVTCVGGVNIRPQIQALRRKHNFVIGTPGRVLDLINRNHFESGHTTTVVLDEADRMLDMGFIGDIRKILSGVPQKRQTLLFSATISAATKGIINTFLKNPVHISVKKKDVAASIEQNVVEYKEANKFELLVSLLNKTAFKRVLIFGAMKHSVEKLAKQLSASGVKAESIHGNKSHGQRQRSLGAFKNGNARVLVATDVAARGIHVDDVSHVINYDLPNTFEDYVHRIGRTGRVDKQGIALTFVPLR